MSGSKFFFPHFDARTNSGRTKGGLTFRDVEAWKQELAISHAAFTPPGVAHHTRYEVPNIFNVLHQFFGGNLLRERAQG